MSEKANHRDAVDWARFKVLSYKKYFLQSTRDEMLSRLWALKQGIRFVVDYKAEFNCLIKFIPWEIKDSNGTKIQQFHDGLNLELQHDIRFEMDNLGALVNNAKSMEEICGKIKAQSEPQKSRLGKRSYGTYEPR